MSKALPSWCSKIHTVYTFEINLLSSKLIQNGLEKYKQYMHSDKGKQGKGSQYIYLLYR